MKVNSFEELRLTGQLPSPSGVGMQILRLTQGDDFSTEEIGQAISADSALTGRLLKLANSAESGSVEPVTTIGEATIRLGIRTVGNVALGLSLVSTSRVGGCSEFDYDNYWSKSLARAVTSQRLSSAFGKGVPAELYILGLLAGVGSLALASVHPDAYGQMLASRTNETFEEIEAAEEERFEITHSEVAVCILRDWGLPESFGESVREFEKPYGEEDEPKLEDQVEILRAADLIAEILVANEETSYDEYVDMARRFEQLQAGSGLEPEAFQRLCSEFASHWREWGKLLSIPTAGRIDFGDLRGRAEQALSQHREDQACGEEARPAGKPTKADEASAEPDDSKLHILAVEDDASSLLLLQRYLVRAGHRVTTARDGEEALRLALEECPDLVVADWDMPSLDGVNLCQALRKISSGQRIYFVLLTGVEGEDQILQAFESGVDDYVVKPFNPRILMARIHAGRRIISLQRELDRERRKQEKQNMELQVLTRKLRSAALTDPLTGLSNRRYAMKRMSQAWESSSRTKKPLSAIMMDIDFFKKVNDTYGHDAGDEVLKATASSLEQTARKEEDVCRIGGEEFIMICAGASAEEASAAAERLRAIIEEQVIPWNGVDHKVTLSLGVAERTAGMDGPDDLLKSADQAVYVAKESGRNQVQIAKDPGSQLRESA